MNTPPISIIIPVINESENLKRLLLQLSSFDPEPQIIVVDGGSTDDSLRVVLNFGAELISSAAGRGKQLNIGASQACGHILLFLHADSFLPQNSYYQLLSILNVPSVGGGAFQFSLYPHQGLWPKVYEVFVNARARFFHLPYGDQGYWIKKEMWSHIGGFPEIPLMEDVVWWNKLQRKTKTRILNVPLHTSPRRFQKRGWFRSAILNWTLLLGFYCGISPHRLAKWYNKARVPK